MYRLFGGRKLTAVNFKFLTIQKTVHWSDNKSILHTQIFHNVEKLENSRNPAHKTGESKYNYQTIRYQSITPSEEILKILNIQKNITNKKYIELLQVTNSSSKQTRTAVRNLRAKNLSNFIYESGKTKACKTKRKNQLNSSFEETTDYSKVNLEMLEHNDMDSNSIVCDESPVIFFGKSTPEPAPNIGNVNEIMDGFLEFKTVSEQIANDSTAPIEERTEVSKKTKNNLLEEEIVGIENDILKTLKASETSEAKSTDQNFKSKHQSPEHALMAKKKSLSNHLSTYLEACIASGILSHGYSTLLSYRYRYKQFPSAVEVLDVNLYNIVLHGYAENGNFDKVKEILLILREDQIKPNAQTFAAILECLGRLEPAEINTKLIKKCCDAAATMGFTTNDIVDKSKFSFDQREIIIDAIKRIEPDYKPNYTPPPFRYSNKLVNHLDKNVRPFDDEIHLDEVQPGHEIMMSKQGYPSELLKELARQQLSVELNGTITVNSVENVGELKNAEKSRLKLKESEKMWRKQIREAFVRDMNTLRAQSHFKSSRSMSYFTYLKCLEPEDYVEIILKELEMLAKGSETYSPTVSQLYRVLGHKVEAKFHIEQKKKNGILDKTGEIYSQYCDIISAGNSSDNPRQIWQRLVHKNREGPSMDINDCNWPLNVTVGVGRFLYNILMRDIKIDGNTMRNNSKQAKLLPAFYSLFRNQGKYVKEEVKPHPVLAKLFRASQQQTLTFDASLVPMLCPPQPWTTPINGGYLLSKSDLIRLPQQAVQQLSRIENTNAQDLYPSYDALNQLASIAWRVNVDILDVIVQVFNKGGDPKLDVPQPPSLLEPIEYSDNPIISNKEKFEIFRQKLLRRRKQAEMYSLWCDTLYRLSLANHYRDKVFWLPHNMDFRGRVYSVPPHLNHLGSDLARSMLVFDKAKPLGIDGFTWLKLHCINLTGLKKRDSIRERVLYAEEIMNEILDSADNPLTGRMWWAKSDKPWQTLSCCIEIAKVKRSAEPEKYMSRFPIHQDGSCNGLQHYAALGRDELGARSVNLCPTPIPQDVYSEVAALVENTRKVDAENGIEVAKILEGYIRRKVVKQTVMTTVYGVTRYGARIQIAKQLKDIDAFPKEWVWPASAYITTKAFESLREMFTSTKEIQDWFTECARLISGVSGQNVEWVTPMGLPVVQPYSKMERKSLSKNNHKVDESSSMDMYEKPNVLKQKNAFPPNFIHSLDSTHMMLTSLHCERIGLTFISVHDCFWTHACTVPDMNKICREQFVALHSLPILEDLSKFLAQKYSYSESDFKNDGSCVDANKKKLNRVFLRVPEKGNFDLRNVLESVFFFS